MGLVWSFVNGEHKSRKQNAFYKAYKINDALGQKLQAVGLGTKQLFELHEIFNIMDKDSSGEINLMEFFEYIDLKRTRFSEKAFAVMDRDGSGEVDFIEFVLAVWNYCSFSRSSLVRYAFDLYDTDRSGEIELNEASQCVREIWGGEWEQNANAQKVMTKLESIMKNSPHGRLSVVMFEQFAQTHPLLLFPAFQLQTEIQHRVLGERFWLNAAKRRSRLDPQVLAMKSFHKLAHLSRNNSNKFFQTVDDVLHDNLFEEVTLPPQPRKRSTLGNLFSKVKSRQSQVLVDTNDDLQVDDLVDDSSIKSTTAFPNSTSPKAKPRPTKRPPPVQSTAVDPSVSSVGSSTPTTTSASNSPVHKASPKKKKKPKSSAKTDLVVEDVVEPPS